MAPKILLVEDESSICELVCSTLREQFEVVCAENGAAVFEQFKKKEKPDVVLLNYLLPDAAGGSPEKIGLTLLRFIKQESPKTVVIMPTLKHVGLALVEFVQSLQQGCFIRKKAEWIYSFRLVAFRIQYKKVEKIYLSLNEYPKDIEISDADWKILPFHRGGNWYSRVEITSPRQLGCATRYIESCHRIWHRKIFGK
jgi:CheY-like chemotaxis protein